MYFCSLSYIHSEIFNDVHISYAHMGYVRWSFEIYVCVRDGLSKYMGVWDGPSKYMGVYKTVSLNIWVWMRRFIWICECVGRASHLQTDIQSKHKWNYNFIPHNRKPVNIVYGALICWECSPFMCLIFTRSPLLRLTVALMDPLEPASGNPALVPITSAFLIIWRCTLPPCDKNEVVK